MTSTRRNSYANVSDCPLLSINDQWEWSLQKDSRRDNRLHCNSGKSVSGLQTSRCSGRYRRVGSIEKSDEQIPD